MTEMTGGCACGRVRYKTKIVTFDAFLCHCRMCQRASGNVSAAFTKVARSAVRWQQEPDYFASSPIARRGYCAACGSPLSFEYPDSEHIDLTLGSLDDPERFRPTDHYGVERIHRAWLNTGGLPEHRTVEDKVLVERWMKAVGKVPD